MSEKFKTYSEQDLHYFRMLNQTQIDIKRFKAVKETDNRTRITVLWNGSDGEKHKIDLDDQVIGMINGASFGIMNELRDAGHLEEAWDIIEHHRE